MASTVDQARSDVRKAHLAAREALNLYVEELVAFWHESPSTEGTQLHEFLGLTFYEYAAFTRDGVFPERWGRGHFPRLV